MTWDSLLTELDRLAQSLQRKPATEKTAEHIWMHKGKFAYEWQKSRIISVNTGVPLPPPRKQALHPRNCSVGETSLKFVFEPPDCETAPFPKRADFQVRVTGTLELASAGLIELEDHWRVDTHLFALPELLGESEPPKEPHPLFHFQRGGHAQDRFADHPGFVPGPLLDENISDSWRGLMQTPGPRIPVLPMCPILAIDFAIAHCDGVAWRSLRTESECLVLIKNAQERLWTPIFDAFSDREVRKKWMGKILI